MFSQPDAAIRANLELWERTCSFYIIDQMNDHHLTELTCAVAHDS